MSDHVLIAIIAAVPPTLVALITVANSLRVSSRLTQIHIDINSRLTELLSQAKKAARAEGKVEGIAEGVLQTMATSKAAVAVPEPTPPAPTPPAPTPPAPTPTTKMAAQLDQIEHKIDQVIER